MTQIFSIIIPTYNRANFLPRAIESVLLQIYEKWELIIVDDGSTDNTREVVQTFNDERIRYIYQENQERSAARNNGIRNAVGEWICFLDSDDEYKPDHLQLLLDEINDREQQNALYCTGLIYKSMDKTQEKPFLKDTNNWVKEISFQFLLPDQVCVHKSMLKENFFDVRFRLWEDTHLWMRIAAQFPVFQISKLTCIQHVHENSTVQQGFKRIKWEEVNQYIQAIVDLRDNYKGIFQNKFSKKDFDLYIQSKYSMYLYQARQNKQLLISLKIWIKAIIKFRSVYLMLEFPKIFINQFNIGIHNDR